MKSPVKFLLCAFFFLSVGLIFAVVQELQYAETKPDIQRFPVAKVEQASNSLQYKLVEHAIWQNVDEDLTIYSGTIVDAPGEKLSILNLLRQKIFLNLVENAKVVLLIDPYCDDIGPEGLLLRVISGVVTLKTEDTTWLLKEKESYCVHQNGPQAI